MLKDTVVGDSKLVLIFGENLYASLRHFSD